MDKELFIKTIHQIEELNKESEQFNNMIRTIDPEFGGGYIHTKSITILVDLLKILVNDKYDNIDYYMWDLNFGKDYQDGMITDAENPDKIYRLSNPSELYDFIMEENAE